jgi:hypothetical protein
MDGTDVATLAEAEALGTDDLETEAPELLPADALSTLTADAVSVLTPAELPLKVSVVGAVVSVLLSGGLVPLDGGTVVTGGRVKPVVV